MNRLLTLLAVMVTVPAVAAGADDDKKGNSPAVVQRAVATYDELAALRAENALLKAQVENAELRNKLNPGSLKDGGGGRSAHAANEARVQVVGGVDGNLTATIRTADGANAVARVGSKIPGLGVVKSIKTDEVLVLRGKEVISVPFAVEPVGNAASGYMPFGPSGLGAPSPMQAPVPVIPGRN